MICLRRWKKKVISRIFMWIEDKYGGFKSTHEKDTLRGVWTTRRRREPRMGGKGKPTNFEIDLIALLYTLPRVQVASWREWEDGSATFFGDGLWVI